MKKYKIQSLDGLEVFLDKLVYEYNEEDLPLQTPHAFIYSLTISNSSNQTIKLLGRKWILQSSSENTIVEGENIVGQTPILPAGKTFSYTSYHLASENTKVRGAFYGIDEQGQAIHALIPEFEMNIPQPKKLKEQNEIRRSQ